jgi:hypothetical protein
VSFNSRVGQQILAEAVALDAEAVFGPVAEPTE